MTIEKQIQEQVRELAAAVARGELTPEGAERIAEAVATRLLEGNPSATLPPPPPQATPETPWLEGVSAVETSDLVLAMRGLMREDGLNEKDAKAMLFGADLNKHAATIQRQRELEQNRINEEARLRWNDSPDGRRFAAQALVEAQEKREADLKLARVWLSDQLGGQPIDKWSDDDVLKAFNELPEEPDSLAKNVEALAAKHSKQNGEAS